MTSHDLVELFYNRDFPRSSTYDPEWIVRNQMGPHPLWLTESLTQSMPLEKGMRVLDLGCGMAMSSVFLAREFEVEVWAADLWIPPTENLHRIKDEELDKQVYPIHAEAHELPFADGFFDAIVSMDSYHYFGTDVHYLEYITRFLEPGGQLGIVSPASRTPLPLPNSYPEWVFFFNSIGWWRHHWDRSPAITVHVAEELPQGWRHWMQWQRMLLECGLELPHHNSQEDMPSFIALLEEDKGEHIGFVKLVGQKPRENRAELSTGSTPGKQ